VPEQLPADSTCRNLAITSPAESYILNMGHAPWGEARSVAADALAYLHVCGARFARPEKKPTRLKQLVVAPFKARHSVEVACTRMEAARRT